jgi:hypothetical protein
MVVVHREFGFRFAILMTITSLPTCMFTATAR